MITGNHYEQALKAYLREKGLPFVALDQTRMAILAGEKIKSFDLIISPPERMRILCDVKGRKLDSGACQRGRLGDSWATRQDVEGLRHWQNVFGPDTLAAFIFAFWIADEGETDNSLSDNHLFQFDSRRYLFVVMELSAYCLKMRQRSPRWQTVYVPARAFRTLALPIMAFIKNTA